MQAQDSPGNNPRAGPRLAGKAHSAFITMNASDDDDEHRGHGECGDCRHDQDENDGVHEDRFLSPEYWTVRPGLNGRCRSWEKGCDAAYGGDYYVTGLGGDVLARMIPSWDVPLTRSDG